MPTKAVLEITQPYLHLPVSFGAPKRWLRLYVAEEMVREFEIELAEGAPAYWVFCDVTEFQGQLLTIEAEDSDLSALDGVRQAASVPDLDGLYRERHRPQFHYTPRRGWVNDPNGLVYYDGEYHLFYQHNPYGVKWGNMHWGHAVSRDLVHWQEYPEALYPDRMGTMFSGSAVVDWHNTAALQEGVQKTLVAIYTAAGGTSPQSQGQPFTQCIAYSNDRGRTWSKHRDNPVLGHVAGRNRDPKVFWHAPTNRWVMILYLDGSEFGLFAAPDLKQWTLLSKIDLPGMHEVPDLFELPVDDDPENRKWVLVAGHERFVTEEDGQKRFENGHYVIGEFDGIAFQPENGPYQLDMGEACYSTQTFSDILARDGRRIQIAWLSTDFGSAGYPGMPFHGQFCFPCQLSLRTLRHGVRLCRQPVKEIEQLYWNTQVWDGRVLSAGQRLAPEIQHDLLDIRAEIDLSRDAECELLVGGTAVRCDAFRGEIHCFGRTASLGLDDGRMSLRLLVDRTSVEIFAQGGSVCMSGYAEPRADTPPFDVIARQGTLGISKLQVHALGSIWK